MDLSKYLFFDIETHRVLDWDKLDPAIQRAFCNHYWDEASYAKPEDHYNEIAGLHCEFSHVICVSFGYETLNGLKVGHICSTNDSELLDQLTKVFDAFDKQGYSLAGHNVLSCDIPYLIKRYIINKKKVPHMLSKDMDAKPWEKSVLDTMGLWKMGSYRATSLEMACACLGIPCKSEEVSGANLYTYPLDKIPMDELAVYCDEDVKCCYELAKKTYEYL